MGAVFGITVALFGTVGVTASVVLMVPLETSDA
jgi:hypothetical protein